MSQVAAVGVQKVPNKDRGIALLARSRSFGRGWYSVVGGAVAVIEGVRQRWVSRRVWGSAPGLSGRRIEL